MKVNNVDKTALRYSATPKNVCCKQHDDKMGRTKEQTSMNLKMKASSLLHKWDNPYYIPYILDMHSVHVKIHDNIVYALIKIQRLCDMLCFLNFFCLVNSDNNQHQYTNQDTEM